MISFSTRLLFAAYFLEAGLILLVAPWSTFWERNFFAASLPAIERIVQSPYARGAVSGVGLVTMLAGLADLAAAFASRRSASDLPSPPTLPSGR